MIRDADFQRWCGDAPCDWTLEAGRVEQVPTWHPKEPGVRFVDVPTVLSQPLSDAISCLRFDVLADVDARASLLLELDFLDDGRPEFRQLIVGERYEGVTFFVRLPQWYRDAVLRLVLEAPGRARVARLRVRSVAPSECGGQPLELDNRPRGAPCSDDEQCGSGVCINRCMDCRSTDDCSQGRICSWSGAAPEAEDGWTCREAGTAIDGELCTEDEVCAEGGCRDRRCSCRDASDCGDGEVCGWNAPPPGEPGHPYVACEAASSASLGELCLADDECSTGICCEGYCSTCCPNGVSCELGECRTGSQVDRGNPAEWDVFGGLPFQCDPAGGSTAPGERCLLDSDCVSGRCTGAGPLRRCLLGERECAVDSDCLLACWTIGRRDGVCE